MIVNLPLVTELFCIEYRGYLAFGFVQLVMDLNNSFATFQPISVAFSSRLWLFCFKLASFEVMVGRSSWHFYLIV